MMEMTKVGVQTRAKALALASAAAAAATTARKRKVSNRRLVMHIELRSTTKRQKRRVIISTPENSVSVSQELLNSGNRNNIIDREEEEDRCSSHRLGCSDHASASCCSSNGSSTDDRRIIEFADLQDQRSVEVETSMYYSCRERRETTPSSRLREDELDSTARPSSTDGNTRRRSTTARKMPTESELEDFFANAEKNIQRQFADRYNYDIVKDQPLKGRYEWVRLKP